MVTVSQPGTYYVTPQDNVVQITNNVSVIVVLPQQGSVTNGVGQAVMVQDKAGGAQINLVDQAGNINLLMTNYERVTAVWNPQTQAWFI